MATRINYTISMISSPLSLIKDYWLRQTLARRYIIASIIFTMMAVIAHGIWLSRTIETELDKSIGTSGAMFVSSYLAPYLQDLEFSDSLSPQIINTLDTIHLNYGPMMRFNSIKIWKPSGKIVYSSDKNLMGQVFDNVNIERAAKGFISSRLEEHPHPENAAEL